MKTRFAPVSQKKSLGYALRPYTHWDDWIISSAQPFSKRELALIEAYRLSGSYAACAELLLISMVEAANQIAAIILKLKFQLYQYKKWEAGEKSLYNIVSSLGILSIQDLKAITLNDLKRFYDSDNKIAVRRKGENKAPVIK